MYEPTWTIVTTDLPTFIGLEDGVSVLLMENETDMLVWGDVWTEI